MPRAIRLVVHIDGPLVELKDLLALTAGHHLARLDDGELPLPEFEQTFQVDPAVFFSWGGAEKASWKVATVVGAGAGAVVGAGAGAAAVRVTHTGTATTATTDRTHTHSRNIHGVNQTFKSHQGPVFVTH